MAAEQLQQQQQHLTTSTSTTLAPIQTQTQAPPLSSPQSSFSDHEHENDDNFTDTTRSRSLSSSSALSSVPDNSTSPSTTGSQSNANGHTKFLLPIPTPSSNRSQSSFAMSEVSLGDGEGGIMMEGLSDEIAKADLDIAANGTYVETTSGAAARELKRRYDKLYGVSKELRSPYMITSLTNQHGKQVFRIGLRSQMELSVSPQPDYEGLYSNVPSSSVYQNGHANGNGNADPAPNANAGTTNTKRRSRLSGMFLAPGSKNSSNTNASATSGSGAAPAGGYGYGFGGQSFMGLNGHGPNGNSNSQGSQGYGYGFGYDSGSVYSNSTTLNAHNASNVSGTAATVGPSSGFSSGGSNGASGGYGHSYAFGGPFGMFTSPVVQTQAGKANASQGQSQGQTQQLQNAKNSSRTKSFSPTRVLRRTHSIPELSSMANSVGTSKNGSGARVVDAKAETVSSASNGASSGGGAANGRTHSHSVTAADLPRLNISFDTESEVNAGTRSSNANGSGAGIDEFGVVDAGRKSRGGRVMTTNAYTNTNMPDMFSRVLGWTPRPYIPSQHPYQNPSASSAFSPYSSSSSHPYTSFTATKAPQPVSSSATSTISMGTTATTTTTSSGASGVDVSISISDAVVRYPFGRGVTFDSPSRGRMMRDERERGLGGMNNSTGENENGVIEGLSSPTDIDVNVDAEGAYSPTLKSKASTSTILFPPSTSASIPLPIPGLVVREMKSFESADTARQVKLKEKEREVFNSTPTPLSGDPGESPSKRDTVDSYLSTSSVSTSSRPNSRSTTYSHQHSHSPSHKQSQTQQALRITPSYESSLHTRYQTSVFDVLQHYRGLPLLDTLDSMDLRAVDSSANLLGESREQGSSSQIPPSAAAEPPTIKMSLAQIDSMAPLDDPRFVIWGEVGANASITRVSGEGEDRGMGVEGSEAVQADAGGLIESNVGSAGLGVGRKKSVKARSVQNGPNGTSSVVSAPMSTSVSISSTEGNESKRQILAATIERWIAQLTSQLDHDELLTFFLTYRTYLSPVDLLQLLICRFHWALEVDDSMSHEDVLAKRLARVRTSTAIRFWLITFFRVDWLYNRPLRLGLMNWLNVLAKDEVLERLPDAMIIVKKMKKVVKECKEAHISRSRYAKKSISSLHPRPNIDEVIDISREAMARLPPQPPASVVLPQRKATIKADDSDVDLDFDPEEELAFLDSPGFTGFSQYGSQFWLGSNGLGGAGQIGGHAFGQNGVASAMAQPSAARIMLQQPLHMTILQHARIGTSDADARNAPPPAPLPVHHSTLSRVVVNTIGKLGRWKRVLSSRAPHPQHLIDSPLLSASNTTIGMPAALDLELNATGDLLNVKGGVERYLKVIEPIEADAKSPSAGRVEDETESAKLGAPPPYSDIVAALEAVNTTPSITVDEPESIDAYDPDNDASSVIAIVALEAPVTNEPSNPNPFSIEDSPSTQEESAPHTPLDEPKLSVDGTYPPRAASAASQRSQLSQKSWHPAIVSLDDLDSDEESSIGGGHLAGPPGLKRLPRRKDFEFLRRSMDSVSSLSIMTRPSLVAHQDVSEQSSDTSSHSSQPRLGDGLQQWQVDALIDDLSEEDDAPGDADAALRRLEGQINIPKQRAKEKKVDGWVKSIQERMLKGDFGDQPHSFPEVDSDDDYGTGAHSRDLDSKHSSFLHDNSSAIAISSRANSIASDSVPQDVSVTPTSQQTIHSDANPSSISLPSSNGTEDRPTDHSAPISTDTSNTPVIAQTPAQSHTPRHTIYTNGIPPSVVASPRSQRSIRARQDLANFIAHGAPSPHRSFILSYRSENIAHHLGMIDRDLFLAVKPQELVSEDWMMPDEDTNALDWNQYVADGRKRSIADTALRGSGKARTSALVAARARFNIVAKFVTSEIMFTHPHERIAVVNKFIRVAWKAYCQNNFATLVALISGLGSDWVRRALKGSKGNIGIWESRVWEDLRMFASSDDDFLYIRQAIAALSDNEHLSGVVSDDMATTTGAIDGASTLSGGMSARGSRPVAPPSCVPFFGVYLSQLYRLSKLPDLIDPSEPTRRVESDPVTGNFKAPAHPEVFATLRPLPPSMQLEPLINVQKQRLIASVIRSLVAGQHLANKANFPIDRKLLQRCLKLRAMDFDALHTVT